MSISKKALLTGAVSAVLLIGLVLFLWVKVSTLQQEYTHASKVAKVRENVLKTLAEGLQFSNAVRKVAIDATSIKAEQNANKSAQKLEALLKDLGSAATKKVSPGYEKYGAAKAAKAYRDDIAEVLSHLENQSLTLEVINNSTKKWRAIKGALLEWKAHCDREVARLQQQFYSDINSLLLMGVSIALAIVLILSGMLYTLFTNIIKSLQAVQHGLDGFFAFVGKKSETSELIEINSEDEFGQMAKLLNENIEATKRSIEADNRAVGEIARVVEQAKEGFFMYTIDAEPASEELKAVKDLINEMLSSTYGSFQDAIELVNHYVVGDYAYKSNASAQGNLGSFVAALTVLGQGNSDVFATIKYRGEQVKQGAQKLLDVSQELSTATNQQAASLEGTSASMEEISGNVQNNTDKAISMAGYANEAMNSTIEGKELANQTVSSMESINEAAKKIGEAVNVIDSIAFQTNILSLNAAVEAANAGEAGKGFAVVAQEVRNLASRSANAAQEIQQIVNEAQEKTSQGQDVATQMLEGFNEINEKIKQTQEMVNDVTESSKEQMSGIEQINDALAQLDTMTQQNTKTAQTVSQMSKNLSQVADNLHVISEKTSVDPASEKRVCDIDMIFDANGLKLDHVKFKEGAYKKLIDATSKFTVTDHHGCNLGRWIDNHQGDDFTDAPYWNSFLDVHAHVHKGVQNYVDSYFSGGKNHELFAISKEIEQDTFRVFEYLDEAKLQNCKAKAEQETVQQDHTSQLHTTARQSAQPAKPSGESETQDQQWESF